MCVCVWERERERERKVKWLAHLFYFSGWSGQNEGLNLRSEGVRAYATHPTSLNDSIHLVKVSARVGLFIRVAYSTKLLWNNSKTVIDFNNILSRDKFNVHSKKWSFYDENSMANCKKWALNLRQKMLVKLNRQLLGHLSIALQSLKF